MVDQLLLQFYLGKALFENYDTLFIERMLG